MQLKISTRLQLAIVLVVGLTALLVTVASRWNLERAFVGYLDQLAIERFEEVLPRLEQAYSAHGDWDAMVDSRRLWFKVLRGDTARDDQSRQSFDTSLDTTGAFSRLGLRKADGDWIAGYRGTQKLLRREPIVVRGQTVGWLVLAPFTDVAHEGSQRFIEAQWRVTAIVALLAIALAAVGSWWVTRQLLAPITQMAHAATRLSAGHYDLRINARTDDSIGQLANDFNTLAATLQRNESLRRDFFADISHDLRTPLAVLTGELDALEDGVRPLNPEAVRSLQTEANHLKELVERLHELALSDVGALAYRMEALDLSELVRQAVEALRGDLEKKGLTASVSTPREPAMVQGDKARLNQLLRNLLHNSGRYTDAPGQVTVSLDDFEGGWRLEVADSAPGVSTAQFDRLFERFFRVEASRNRATGGAGLGLAIARNIVQAHGGTIGARPSSLGGLAIRVWVPRLRNL